MVRWYTFDSHGADSQLKHRDGERIEFLGRLDPKDYDVIETGPMYRIRFQDGFETDAFSDEIIVNYGWRE